jgi:hypothetical protein
LCEIVCQESLKDRRVKGAEDAKIGFGGADAWGFGHGDGFSTYAALGEEA